MLALRIYPHTHTAYVYVHVMCSCVSKRKVDVCRVALIDLVSNLDINETDSEETDGCESEAECLG